jgi:hypothetical protein
LINREILLRFTTHLQNSFQGSGELFLVGQTSILMEGWTHWVEEIEFTANVFPEDRSAFDQTVESFRTDNDIRIIEESPEEVIPLPDGYTSRHRKIQVEDLSSNGNLKFYHFDPYSVAFRYIARGDEQDYHLVLNFLKHGWITEEEMNRQLDELLPRFSFQTIQQDPAEFRRRYKGLLQMWHAERPKPTLSSPKNSTNSTDKKLTKIKKEKFFTSPFL